MEYRVRLMTHLFSIIRVNSGRIITRQLYLLSLKVATKDPSCPPQTSHSPLVANYAP